MDYGDFSDASSLSDGECYDCSDKDDDRYRDDLEEAVAAYLELTDQADIIQQACRRNLVAVEKSKSHAVLTQQDIHQRLGEELAATAELFSVPADWALALLVHYGWNTLRLHEEWFVEQDRIRDAVGLGGAAAVPGDEIVTCGVCAEAKPAADTSSAGCDHRYCHDCWRGYVAAALEDARCLALRCPDPSCSRAPCTAPGCGLAIELAPGREDDADLECRCGNAFCWRCGGAPHWPAGCAAAARWARAADGASGDWILLHTKPCPACRRPIERAPGGCDNMECAPPCGHRFCWGCLAPTPAYGATVWRCCELEQPPPETEAEKEDKARARLALDLFTYCHDLWMDNFRERRKAEAELRKLRSHEMLPRTRAEAESGCLEMVEAAWEQVAEGRRVLGNACAHGKWLQEADKARCHLFEFQHGEADAVLERLQQCVVKGAAAAEETMEVFRQNLFELTRAARRGIDNFTKAVEDGMPEVGAQAASSSKRGTSKGVISRQ
ncbi:unnamed protein product [Urochloa decumbens]|uniref:RBR-type E3 ubiquitin transferase n=1 Tax=Urochloa decumbens TaxID=240449 RepID=A0ABC9C5E1_9POAL